MEIISGSHDWERNSRVNFGTGLGTSIRVRNTCDGCTRIRHRPFYDFRVADLLLRWTISTRFVETRFGVIGIITRRQRQNEDSLNIRDDMCHIGFSDHHYRRHHLLQAHLVQAQVAQEQEQVQVLV